MLLFLILIFFFPMAIYCAVLASVNRQQNPVMVTGVGDFVGLLFAVSGFLLVAGPAILSGFYKQSERELLILNSVPNWILQSWGNWWWIWGAYYGIILLGILLTFRLRRSKTIIYNLDSESMNSFVFELMERSNRYWFRQGNSFFVGEGKPDDVNVSPVTYQEMESMGKSPMGTVSVSQMTTQQSGNEKLCFTLEPFYLLRNLTIQWHEPESPIRAELESEISTLLPQIYTRNNPVGGWLLGVSGAMFGLMSLSVVMMLVFLIGFQGNM